MVEMDEAIVIVNKILDLNNIQVPENIIEDLASAYIRRNLTYIELNKLVLKLHESYEAEEVVSGEAVGVVAGQSIGEVITQMLYDASHTGNSDPRHVRTVSRLIEILDARHLISTPTMEIYLEEGYKHDEEFAITLANRIGKSTLNDILSYFRLDYANMSVNAVIDEKKIYDRRLDYDSIIETITKHFRGAVIEDNNLTIGINADNAKHPIRELRLLGDKVRDLQISGKRGIGKVIIRKAEIGFNEIEYIIHTEGSNLRDIFNMEGIDKTRTTTNNIHEIEMVLGIEAARNAIIMELSKTLEEQEVDVDMRHIMLIADMMTSEGVFKSVGKFGISGDKSSVLARSAFDNPTENMLKAALRGETDNLDGVVENMIVGNAIPTGTGSVNITMKPDANRR